MAEINSHVETVDKPRSSPKKRGGDLPYLVEARRLYDLLTDGAKPAGFHIRNGYWLRNAATKRLLLSTYTNEWRPARDVLADGTHEPRKLTSYHLSYHLRGKYSVAWTAPSWTSLIVLDIDRPNVPADADADAHWQADAQRDEVLAAVWDAFDCNEEKQPVVLATPGGGYHLYFPLSRTSDPGERERTWPAAWARERFEYHLAKARIPLRPGTLELYPSGVRLRAPCGRGTALLRPQNPNQSDDLRLEPVEARFLTVVDGKTGEGKHSLRRRIGPMVTAFCDAIDASRLPMESWLDDETAAWSKAWGPFGDRIPKKQDTSSQELMQVFQHREEVPISRPKGRTPLGKESGLLLHGKAFTSRIRSLAQEGLTDPGTRHDAALKLAWHLGVVEGLSRQGILDHIRDWLLAHPHESATRDRGESGFVRETLREVANYYDTRVRKVERWRGRAAPRLLGKPLGDKDVSVIERCVQSAARSAATAILRHIKAHCADDGRVLLPLELGCKLLSELCGDGRVSVDNEDGTRSRRRAYVVALEELSRLGLLAIHTNYSVGNHGRRYTCWYQFGTGVIPRETASGGRELATRAVAEGELVLELPVDKAVPVVTLRRRVDEESGEDESTESSRKLPWWERMYARRAFVPADFSDDADSLSLALLGPFRHRFPAKLLKPKRNLARAGPSNSNSSPPAESTSKSTSTTTVVPEPEKSASRDIAEAISDRGLRDAIAKAWAAFEDSS